MTENKQGGLIRWIKKECYHLLPPLIFFFIAFNIINLIEGLVVKSAGVAPFDFFTILITSGIVAKVLIVVDFTPFMNVFPSRPLIYNVLWKSSLYSLASLVVRLVERLIIFYLSDTMFTFENFSARFDWPLFWGIQILFFVLFFLFVTSRELILVIGPAKVRKIFFG